MLRLLKELQFWTEFITVVCVSALLAPLLYQVTCLYLKWLLP
jgi:hypothetical protein